MKKYLLVFALLLGAVSSWGQTAIDQVSVINKIIDLPDLQQYYPKNADGSIKQLCISQFPTEFQAEVVSAFDPSRVVFRNRETIATNQEAAYFVFRSFIASSETAQATVNYLYDVSNGQLKMITVTVSLQKTSGTWMITNKSIGGNTK